MSARFRPGEVVDVHIRGARVREGDEEYGPNRMVMLSYANPAGYGGDASLAVLVDSQAVTVERVAPAGWPPQSGDVRVDRDGLRWFAQDTGASDVVPPVMWMVPAACSKGEAKQQARLLAQNGPLGLAHRAPDVVDAEHAQVSGWGGVAGQCGAQCACGVAFDGFDTVVDAATMLAERIADPDREGTSGGSA